MRYLASIAALAASLFNVAGAQQYAGDTIPNKLPSVPGAEITYFRVYDPRHKNDNLTLINYYSLQSNGKRVDPSQLRRGVVVIHGNARDPGTYMSQILSAMRAQNTDSNVNSSTVAMMAPYFPNGDDKNTGYPWTDGAPAGQGSTSNCLVWPGSKWAAGSYNEYPHSSRNTSSFDVIDQIIDYWSDKSRFPNMEQIVIAGHSEGAQFVQHYVAVGKPLTTTIPVSYWVANPNSYVWLSTDRPFSTASCSSYDVYRDGYTNYTEYPMKYGNDLVASGRAAILARYNSRAVNYARGTQDFGDDSNDCAPFAQGQNRNERFFKFIQAFPPSCPDPAGNNCDTIDYVVSGHDSGKMMASQAGQTRLFLDNFYGNGSRAYDFGYPREQPGDDPYPNPAQVNNTAPQNTNTYAGNKTYYGCWSDQSPPTLSTQLYANSSNTIEFCTTACTNAGYSIAGVEYGTQCYCGNSLGSSAVQTTNTSCAMTCAGNSSEICGGNNRISLFSNGQPSISQKPVTPATVAGFTYYGCQTEATSGRALTGKASTSSKMTLEYCANFCAGYKYWGTEYSDECYCGNSFAAGSNAASSGCTMLCTNNSTEYCGGSNRLTVYQNTTYVSAVASSSSSSSSLSKSSSLASTSTLSSTTLSSTLPSSSTASPVTTSSTLSSTTLSSSSTASSPTASAINCPAANNTIVTVSGKNFAIECGIDHFAGDLTSTSVNSFAQCISACAANPKCVDVSLSGVACYLKSSVGKPVYNQVSGARLVGTASASGSATASSAASATTTTTAAARRRRSGRAGW